MSYKCLKDSLTKKYIIPTAKWLNPLEVLITNSMSSKGFLMLSKFNKTHDVVVKITKNVNYKLPIIKYITKKLLNMPNFVNVIVCQAKLDNDMIKHHRCMTKTFCVFSCIESSLKFDTKYKEQTEFCNKGDDVGEEIMLEIMYKYKNSIYHKRKQLNKQMVEHILKQLIFAQLYAFEKYGFLHMDIHLFNIMYGEKSDSIELKYEFNKKQQSFNTTREFVICDYDKCVVFNEDIPFIEYDENNLLISNIVNTLSVCSELFEDSNDQINFKQIVDDMQIHERGYYYYEEKDLRSLYNKVKSLERYKTDVINNSKSYLNKVWNRFFLKPLI